MQYIGARHFFLHYSAIDCQVHWLGPRKRKSGVRGRAFRPGETGWARRRLDATKVALEGVEGGGETPRGRMQVTEGVGQVGGTVERGRRG